MRLVECVPNFSDGRNREVIDAIAAAIAAVDGATLLDVDPGAGAHRTVVTFVGEPEAALEAGFQAIRTAAERIDMRRHRGEHPRMGATDVFPFVPVAGVTMAECVQLARRLGARVAKELGIPVYLYEQAATRPQRRSLADVRAGEYEGLAAKLRDPAWKPDFGPAKLNPRSGATAIGARKFLAAYNVDLNTAERKYAVRVAKRVRELGLPIRAIGWVIPEYRCAQVSMNLIDLDRAGLHDAFDACERIAGELGLRVTGSELVGLVPERALLDAGRHYLRRMGRSPGAPHEELLETAVRTLGLGDVAPFDPQQRIVERRLLRADRLAALSLEGFAARLGAVTPTPGGGSAAALAASCGSALAAMVAGLTYEQQGAAPELRAELDPLAVAAQEAARTALRGVDEDAAAYESVRAASRLPRRTPEETAARAAALDAANRRAAQTPLALLAALPQVVETLETLVRRGHPACTSDVLAAAALVVAAADAAHANVLANLPGIGDRRWTARQRGRADSLRRAVLRRAAAVAARARRMLAAAAGSRKGGGG
ncbi:MAG: glutamate formimidoyltransferase [Deltaproteobacteria bacterium]|nr:glutamate formimidoyltransferase [Deltaproteobacteria bacterium]